MQEFIKKKVNVLVGIAIIFIIAINILLFIVDKFHLEKNIATFDFVFGMGFVFLLVSAIVVIYFELARRPAGKTARISSEHEEISHEITSAQKIEEQKFIWEVNVFILFVLLLIYLPLLEKYVDAMSLFVILFTAFLFVKLMFYFFFDLALIEERFKKKYRHCKEH